jgi:hypothetical protein
VPASRNEEISLWTPHRGGTHGLFVWHASHGGRVDDQSFVANRATCHLVSSATNAHRRVALAHDPHCLNDVRGVSAPGDGGRMTVNQSHPSRRTSASSPEGTSSKRTLLDKGAHEVRT